MLENPKKIENREAAPSSRSLDLLLNKIEQKQNLKDLNSDLGKVGNMSVATLKSEVLKSSVLLNDEEKKLDEHGKKNVFKEKYSKSVTETEQARRQNMILKYALRGEDINEIDKKVLLERLIEIRQILEKYNLESPEDILNADPEVVKLFAAEFSKVVRIDAKLLLKEWIDLRNDQIEFSKIRKLLGDEKASEELYQAAKAGKEVDYAKLYEEHAELFKEESKVEADLKNKEVILQPDLPNSTSDYMQELSPLEKKEVTMVLKACSTSPQDFDKLMSFVGGNVDPASIQADDHNKLAFEIASPEGLQISVTKVGDEIVLKDPSGDVKVKIGDKDSYQLETQIFDVVNALQIMEKRGEISIPKNLRAFIYGRSLAKFVEFISDYRVSIAGHSEGNKIFEVRKIYEYLLAKPEPELRKLKREMEKSPEEREIWELAMREQKFVK